MPDAPSVLGKKLGVGTAIIAALIAVTGLAMRSLNDHALASTAQDNATPLVSLVALKRDTASQTLVLPGNIQAYNTAAIYARTSGYLRRWLVDIGDHVQRGQTLAIIDAPDVEQQLIQAQADYQTALANRALAKTTAARWTELLTHDAVSKQETDEKTGDLAAKNALANSALANVNRLRVLLGFTRIQAPFEGTVTSRSTQIGALIVAGNAASTPLFNVSDVHKMRIYVRVPQSYSAQIHVGQNATLTVPEFPTRSFNATVVHSASAVDPQSGTVLIELQSDNTDHALQPGAYAQVTLPIMATAASFRVPASAIITRDSGLAVAVAQNQDANGLAVAKVVPIKVGQDDGDTVEVVAGLTGNERLIDTPPDALANGDKVRIVTDGLAKGGTNAPK